MNQAQCLRGEGPSGLLGRMRLLLRAQRRNARIGKYLPTDIPAEDLVIAWDKQQGKCAATGRPVTVLDVCLEHNHQTGEFRGFVIPAANRAEGYLATLTPQEHALFLERAFPEVYALIARSIRQSAA